MPVPRGVASTSMSGGERAAAGRLQHRGGAVEVAERELVRRFGGEHVAQRVECIFDRGLLGCDRVLLRRAEREQLGNAVREWRAWSCARVEPFTTWWSSVTTAAPSETSVACGTRVRRIGNAARKTGLSWSRITGFDRSRRPVVQAALELHAEQRLERLAVADALDQIAARAGRGPTRG